MTLRQMEYLLAVIEEQSFTRASERLNVTQSGLSQQIQALERAVGAALLERLPRGVRLTAAGEAFAQHARTALRAAQRAHTAVVDVTSGRTGRLEIATVLSIAVGILPSSLARWNAERPGVTVTLLEFPHRRLLEEAVAEGTADIAVGPRPLTWTGPVAALGTERFVLILPPNDPLRAEIVPYVDPTPPPATPRSHGSLPLRKLFSRGWVMLSADNGLSELVESHLGAAGLVHPLITLRTRQTEAAARLGAAGVGAALLPANVVPRDLPALICEPDPPLTRPLAAYARSAFTPTTDLYVRFLAREQLALDPA